jgi:riboflavin kinase
MRIQLVGFLREEKKFDSFPELIAQINADVQDAKTSLDYSPFQSCRKDPFLSSNDWVGTGGGDSIASWEVAPMTPFLKRLDGLS